MRESIIGLVVVCLVIASGCQYSLGGESAVTSEIDVQQTDTMTIAESDIQESTATPDRIDQSVKNGLENFAQAQELAFREETNLSSIEVFRQEGTANITVEYHLPSSNPETREASFENSIEALVQSQYNWVVNGSESNQAEYITVKTDYGTASASADLLQLYIDGKLNKQTVAYIWAGKFDRYTEFPEIDNAGHNSRQERLQYTATVVERQLETNASKVKNIETAIEDETLYIAYEETEQSPNPTHAKTEVAYAYYNATAKFGIDYMPYNGLRGYGYSTNGTAQITWFVENRWVISEHVGLRPYGEVALNSLNSINFMDGPHEGPP